MKRLTHLMTYLVIISSLALLWSCSNDDNTVRQDDTPVRIGIAWRGDSALVKQGEQIQLKSYRI